MTVRDAAILFIYPCGCVNVEFSKSLFRNVPTGEKPVGDIIRSSFIGVFYDKIAAEKHNLKQEQKSIWN